MNSHWRNGYPLVIDDASGYLNNSNGDGFRSDSTGTPIDFAYPGNSYDTSGAFAPMAPTNWFESPANLADKRAIASVGYSDTLSVGNELRIKVALFMARDSNTINSFDAAYEMAVKINQYQEMLPTCSGSRLISVEEEVLPEFKLYPNPAKNYLVISMQGDVMAEASIVNSYGVLLSTIVLENSETVVDLSKFPAGIYFLRIGAKAEKFVVVK
jgi:hypothetical protein